MEDDDSSSFAVVRDPKAAAFLADLERVQVLLPFLERERTVSDVARELDLPLDAMYYRVRRLVELGLLQPTRTVPRKGRALTLYRARASHFFAPLDALPKRTAEDFLAEGDEPTRRRVARSVARVMLALPRDLRMGLHVRLDDEGRPSVGLGPEERGWRPAKMLDAEVPAIVSSWMPLRLGFEDAKALQRELFDLIERYAGRGGPDAYLLGLQLAPVDEA
jgi:hypothetical protein